MVFINLIRLESFEYFYFMLIPDLLEFICRWKDNLILKWNCFSITIKKNKFNVEIHKSYNFWWDNGTFYNFFADMN